MLKYMAYKLYYRTYRWIINCGNSKLIEDVINKKSMSLQKLKSSYR